MATKNNRLQYLSHFIITVHEFFFIAALCDCRIFEWGLTVNQNQKKDYISSQRMVLIEKVFISEFIMHMAVHDFQNISKSTPGGRPHLLLRLVRYLLPDLGFPPVCPTGIHLLCGLVELVTSPLDWSDYSQRDEMAAVGCFCARLWDTLRCHYQWWLFLCW